MAEPDPHAALRDWLAAALRSGRPPPLDDDAVAADALLAVADQEGVVAVLEARLRAEGGWDGLPQAHREALQAHARGLAAQWLQRGEQLRQLERTLAEAGLRVLLLKGSALSLWLYPQPYLRMGGDIDLLLESFAVRQASVALAGIGYAAVFEPGDTHFETTLRRSVDGHVRAELDLHARLLNAAAYADVFGFDELWDEAQPLPDLGDRMRALSPRHALAHACLNRALDMQNGIPDRLKLLYDLRLLAARSTPADWDALGALAENRKIAGVCLRSLDDAVHWLGASIPAEVRSRLETLAEREPLDYRRLDDWRYMQWQNLRALPSLGARLHWLRQRLLPDAAQLRELYGEGPLWRLWLRRFRRGIARLLGARTP